jgi:Yip1-like protein
MKPLRERIVEWVRAYPNYKTIPQTAAAAAGEGGLKESLILIMIAQFLTFVSVSSAILIGSASLQAAYGGPIPASSAILALLKLSVIGLVLFYLISGVFYAVARVLGGTGGFASQCYVLAVFSLCNNVFSFPLTIFTQVQPVGLYMQIIVGLIGIYGIYAQYQGLKSVHKLSMWRTIGVLAVTWVLLLVMTMAALSAASRYLPSP